MMKVEIRYENLTEYLKLIHNKSKLRVYSGGTLALRKKNKICEDLLMLNFAFFSNFSKSNSQVCFQEFSGFPIRQLIRMMNLWAEESIPPIPWT